jgi:transporter family-2 protein
VNYFAMVWAALLGAALSIQVGLNAALRAHLGHPAWAALVSFVVGTAVLAVYGIAVRAPLPGMAQFAAVPMWAWIGGALGALYVASSTVLGPLLGSAALTGLVVAGQMTMALVIDQYGLVGFQQQTITLPRLIGAALVVGGVLLLGRH